MQLLHSDIAVSRSGLTADQIADSIGISVRAVRKKKGVDRFVIGHASTGPGRPVTLYNPTVLALWPGFKENAVQKEEPRKGRSDCGIPRKCTAEQWQCIVDRTKALFLNNAQKNLRMACSEAARQLKAEGVEVPLNVYKRLSRDHTDHNSIYISEYRREQWDQTHDNIWRKKDLAIAMPTLRYDYLSIFESAGWAGEGFGALRAWAIDVRKNDVWVKNDGGFSTKPGQQYLMPSGVYIRDALTGYPLWMEPIAGKTETQEDIIRAYISCGIAWGTFPDIAVAMDNGKSMVAARTKGVIAASLPAEAWERADALPEIFGHKGECSPILLNLPNIPQAAFKAALERSFRQMKDEFDATRFPKHYQGGSRQEAVQLTLAAMPVFPQAMLSAGQYYKELASWLWNDYVNTERPRSDSLTLLKERGIAPSIRAAFEYYGGAPKQNGQWPDGERLARMLFFAAEKPSIVKAKLGYVDATVNGNYARWICKELDGYFNRRIAVIPIPGHEKEHAVLMLVEDKREPVYIGIAANGFIRDISRLADAKKLRDETQNHIRTRLKEERDNVQEANWRNHTTNTALPATSEQTAGQLHEPITTVTDYEIITDDDVDDLLNQVENLL